MGQAMKRRDFLRIVGGGTVLAATGLAGGFVATRRPDRALAAWDAPGSGYADPRLQALSFAILAPNPHNRQPWMVDLSMPGEIRVLIDKSRLLPHTDPYSRQITIGLGCFLELLRMAAASIGYRADADLFPEGENPNQVGNEPVAVVQMIEDARTPSDPLFGYVPARRSNKDAYDVSRTVSSEYLDRLATVGGPGTRIAATGETGEVASLRQLAKDAFEVEMRTPRTYKESVDLFRIGKAEIEANPDGIEFRGMRFELLRAAGLFTQEAAMDMTSPSFEQGLQGILDTIDTSMAFVWLATPGNSRIDQLNAGRDWLRINLQATADGIGTQPLSQALQEYAEMADHYEDIHGRLGKEGETVQMFARLGFGSSVEPSPRWSLESRITSV